MSYEKRRISRAASNIAEPVYLTGGQIQQIEERIREIEEEELPEVTRQYRQSEHGDWKENSPKDAVQHRHELLAAELKELREKLRNAVEIETAGGEETVALGHRVSLLDVEAGKALEFVLVGEHGVGIGFVTNVSPVGKSVIGRKVGEEFEVQVPVGVRWFRVLSVQSS